MRSLILALALTTSACSGNEVLRNIPVAGSVCTVAEQTLIDEKVVYAANVLYNIPAQAYVSAVDRKQLNAATRAEIKPMLTKLYGYTQTIKAAQGTVNCDFSSMKKLHADVIALIPKG